MNTCTVEAPPPKNQVTPPFDVVSTTVCYSPRVTVDDDVAVVALFTLVCVCFFCFDAD